MPLPAGHPPFSSFSSFHGVRAAKPLFYWLECRFVIFAIFVKNPLFLAGQKHGLPKAPFSGPRFSQGRMQIRHFRRFRQNGPFLAGDKNTVYQKHGLCDPDLRRCLQRVWMGGRVLRRGFKKGLSKSHLEDRNASFEEYDPPWRVPYAISRTVTPLVRRTGLPPEDFLSETGSERESSDLGKWSWFTVVGVSITQLIPQHFSCNVCVCNWK